ncbi:MAG: Rrf2 family transcriptional regulator [Eudoraea sp.]|nr:Rrf2 family transcriptional regulator [Eudoraea sp.]MBT8312363.1 Rrf2 family transcriptional regulator [Eudoraea sp.]MBT8323460.1 Rrf2 family transcriptional regulator [Eudoraea sp.]NNJ38774.1 Rrf2 family transcriptional regulator [Flavobacteriaceae bacterium]NNJ41031.1 Rrf2 family transcriptional regulator [Eudoraea sp.]
MLSNACKYAIRAVIYLALNSDETTKHGVKKVAEALEVPQPFLAQLLRKLATDRLVSSSKGPGGGFFLNQSNRDNAVWDIISTIDGTYKFDECFLGLSMCDDARPCPVHHLVSPFKEALLLDFQEKTIASLAREIEEKGRLISLKGLLE